MIASGFSGRQQGERIMDELLGKKTPHSAQAEQAVIGSMLIDIRCIPEVLEKLKADEFYLKRNKDIYETVYSMFAYGQTIDPVTVLDQTKVRGVYEDNMDSYMAELMRMISARYSSQFSLYTPRTFIWPSTVTGSTAMA